MQHHFSGGPRRFVGTFEDYWEHMITFETQRAREFALNIMFVFQ